MHVHAHSAQVPQGVTQGGGRSHAPLESQLEATRHAPRTPFARVCVCVFVCVCERERDTNMCMYL